MTLIRTDSSHLDFQQLVHQLNQYLSGVNGDKDDFFVQFNQIDGLRHVVLCYIDQVAVACGAFKAFDAESVEIKRMFVAPAARRKGLAQALLLELEHWAAESGYQWAVLETSREMLDAVALYQKMGYLRIPNYGQYAGVETSVCMRKAI